VTIALKERRVIRNFSIVKIPPFQNPFVPSH